MLYRIFQDDESGIGFSGISTQRGYTVPKC